MLKFSKGNAKLNTQIGTFSIPAGHTCPFADICLSKANRVTGCIKDGPRNKFRCFAASDEARMPSVRISRWRNFEALKQAKSITGMADLINKSLPKKMDYFRVHVSGDFFNPNYFKAWMVTAKENSKKIFYAYTKAAEYVVNFRKLIPENFRLVVSKGGKGDALIEKHGLVYAEVVFSEAEAKEKGLELDHDDTKAIAAEKPFGLLLHGTQPKGSEAADAWKVIKKTVGGYSAKKKKPVNLCLLKV